MAGNLRVVRAEENIHRQGDLIVDVEYVYHVMHGNGNTNSHRVFVKRQPYEQLAATRRTPALPFEKFIKVLRPFMIGADVAADIPEAFRILDTDNSYTIDIGELAAFLPVIIPGGTSAMLLPYIQKVDKNYDNKLNLDEFTEFIKKGVGRDLVLKTM